MDTDAAEYRHDRIRVQDTVATSDAILERSTESVTNHETNSTRLPNIGRLPANNIDYNPMNFTFPNEDWSDFIASNGPFVQDAISAEQNSLDPFFGFDIPFWFEEEQYWDMLQ
jgi:hypothetical protein